MKKTMHLERAAVSAKAAIEVRDLRHSYDGKQSILDLPSFSLARGERVFLYGPSGSGKTTLLGILSGILEASHGFVEILGQPFSQLSGRKRDFFRGSHIGYIFQMFNLIPYLDVRENILLPLHISPARRARIANGDLDRAAKDLADHLGIGSHLHKPVTELSVGQQQRVAAARALIGSPELVIADEPTSALDTDHREAFLRLLFQETERTGSSILFVSHDQTLKPLFERAVSLNEINHAATDASPI